MPPRGRMRRDYNTRITEDRIASLVSYFGNMSLYLKYSEDPSDDATPNIVMFNQQAKMKSINYSFTHLTHEELVLVREIFNLAFDLAEPIVLYRDKTAKEAFENGDDSYARLIRQKPVMVVRPARRKVERAVHSDLHNHIVDKLSKSRHVLLDINKQNNLNQDIDFGGPDEYHGEDSEDVIDESPRSKAIPTDLNDIES